MTLDPLAVVPLVFALAITAGVGIGLYWPDLSYYATGAIAVLAVTGSVLLLRLDAGRVDTTDHARGAR